MLKLFTVVKEKYIFEEKSKHRCGGGGRRGAAPKKKVFLRGNISQKNQSIKIQLLATVYLL
jgi:hypothetical protein